MPIPNHAIGAPDEFVKSSQISCRILSDNTPSPTALSSYSANRIRPDNARTLGPRHPTRHSRTLPQLRQARSIQHEGERRRRLLAQLPPATFYEVVEHPHFECRDLRVVRAHAVLCAEGKPREAPAQQQVAKDLGRTPTRSRESEACARAQAPSSCFNNSASAPCTASDRSSETTRPCGEVQFRVGPSAPNQACAARA